MKVVRKLCGLEGRLSNDYKRLKKFNFLFDWNFFPDRRWFDIVERFQDME